MSATEKTLAPAEVEVVAKATRRWFPAEYKRKILREADGCKTPGAVGTLLRREGLYSSHLRDKKIAELEREAARWRRRAERAEALVEVQKKLSALLRAPLEAEHS